MKFKNYKLHSYKYIYKINNSTYSITNKIIIQQLVYYYITLI